MTEQDVDTIALLQKVQQQLAFIEKKLDTLIQQSQPKPFNREGSFSKPFRSFRPHRPEHGHRPEYGQGQGQGPGFGRSDRQSYSQGPGSGSGRPDRRGPREGNFARKRKPYFGPGK